MQDRLCDFWVWLHSALGRGLAGIGALSALAWFLWPEDNWHVHPDALAGLIVALATWLASVAPIDKRRATKHDRDLLKKFRALISEGEKDFMRQHDMGNSFSWNSLEGTQQLAGYWTGAEFEFDDKNVQEKFAKLVASATEFIHKLSLGTWMINMPDKWTSAVPPAQRERDEISDKTWERIRDYNDRATQLSSDIDEFIKFARQRIAD